MQTETVKFITVLLNNGSMVHNQTRTETVITILCANPPTVLLENGKKYVDPHTTCLMSMLRIAVWQCEHKESNSGDGRLAKVILLKAANRTMKESKTVIIVLILLVSQL